MKFNGTFNTGSDHSMNACVGNNGWQSLESYSFGYDEAVKILYDSVKLYRSSIDTIVHPMMFSARHRIELFLKAAIKSIGEMRVELTLSDEKIIKTHDLNKLWDIFKDKAKSCDRRFIAFIDECDQIVKEFAEIDPTAETFRYPYSQDNLKHLSDTPIINLDTFFIRYSFVSERMHDMHFQFEAMIREYETKTFTSKLSRTDLCKIAIELPDRDNWGNEKFLEIKAKLTNDYELSGRNFSEALDVIQANRQLSSYIGKEIPLSEISENKIILALEIVRELDSIKLDSDKTRIFPSEDVVVCRQRILSKLDSEFTHEEVASLYTLLELGSLPYYCESYDYLYDKYSNEDKSYMVQLIASNQMLGRYFKRAAEILGLSSLVTKIEQYA